jgi:hypothetical protein
MKPRHAAALALVTWYLLIPPWAGKDWDTSAPLNEWNVTRPTFGTRAECQRTKVDFSHLSDDTLGEKVDAELAEASPGQMPTFEQRDRGIKLLRNRLNEMRCVSGDDPRLKSK